MVSVVVCICLTKEWHYLKVWPCWSRCGLVGGSGSLWAWAIRPSS
uniref:Uncharacterized protein n=1 Tax=Anguilla anguilla TaxID=7936 RepID=A0A0E9UG84_ANGAN